METLLQGGRLSAAIGIVLLHCFVFGCLVIEAPVLRPLVTRDLVRGRPVTFTLLLDGS